LRWAALAVSQFTFWRGDYRPIGGLFDVPILTFAASRIASGAARGAPIGRAGEMAALESQHNGVRMIYRLNRTSQRCALCG
jgi:hypothetical protein